MEEKRMEEIIHCKECRFYGWKCTGICENMDAPWNQGGSLVFIEEDDFCSYAEPKEENE